MNKKVFDLQLFAVVTSKLTAGNDKKKYTQSNLKVYALAGNDTIDSSGKTVTIDGGTGNDELSASGKNNVLLGGAGNDYIIAQGSVNSVVGGEGDDNIETYGASTTVVSGSGTDKIFVGGSWSYVDASESDSTDITAEEQNITIIGSTKGYNYISASGSDNSIIGGSSGDAISFSGSNTTVDGGSGNDTINDTAKEKSLINGGNGNDKIFSSANNATINGGAGKDTIESSGNNSFVYGDAGIDHITINGKDNTVSGGAGNDIIRLDETGAINTVVQYTVGDGNDIIYGFKADDKLEIIGGSLKATVKSGNDIVVKTNKGKVTLKNAYTYKDELNLDRNIIPETLTWKYDSPTKVVTLTSDFRGDLVKLTGVKSIDGGYERYIKVNGKTVTVSNEVLDNNDVTVSEGYTLKLDSTVPISRTTKSATIDIEGTDAIYTSAVTSAGYTLSSDKTKITYNTAGGGEVLATIKGIKNWASEDDFAIDDENKTVTLSKGALSKGNVAIKSEAGYTLELAEGLASETISKGWRIDDSALTATFKTEEVTEGYELSSKKNTIVYVEPSGGKTLVKISGINSKATEEDFELNSNDKVVTVSANALGTSKVKISTGYSLELGDDVETPSVVEAGWEVAGTKATYNKGGKTAGYTLASDGKSITYSEASGDGSTLITVDGLKEGTESSQITLKNKTVTFASGIVGADGASVEGGGYTYALSSAGKLTNVGKAATLKGSSKNDTLTGGKGNDSLSGGNGNDKLIGNKGNDTLIGGAGNDTLTGGAGKDVFVYSKSSGNDVITDYKAGQDKIKITSGAITKATVKGKDVIFKVGTGTITVKNGKGKSITTINAKGKSTTKKYTSTQTISANVSNLWFAEENNFVTSDNLSEITKNDLTPSSLEKISATNYDNLTAENDFITYSDK
ncbi:MAG: calcium-binding protein [Selenomonadaceae bacterium]|nr:calcium-binding protein [Selenomonadaceae bacterium]